MGGDISTIRQENNLNGASQIESDLKVPAFYIKMIPRIHASGASITATISQNRVKIGSYGEAELQYVSPPRGNARTGPEKGKSPHLHALARKPTVKKW